MDAVTHLAPTVGVVAACDSLGGGPRFLLSAAPRLGSFRIAGSRAGFASRAVGSRPLPQSGRTRRRIGGPP